MQEQGYEGDDLPPCKQAPRAVGGASAKRLKTRAPAEILVLEKSFGVEMPSVVAEGIFRRNAADGME